MPRPQQKLKYIDLFAGCGGLSLGLHNSHAWKGMFAIERSPDAFETLSHNLVDKVAHFNWPEWLKKTNHDIKDVLRKHYSELSALKGKVDLVAGGPPCQGFSFAGRRREDDERNTLIHSYLDFIELVEPKMILFENVKGFKLGFRKEDRSRGIPYSEVVLERLRQLGYADAQAHIIDFSMFGVPQERKRCIIFATQRGNSAEFFDGLDRDAAEFLKSKGLKSRQSLESAISDLMFSNGTIPSPDTKGFKAGIYSKRPKSHYQRLMRQKRNEYPDSHRFVNHSKVITEKFRQVIKQKLTSNQVRQLFNTKKCSTKLLKPELPTPTLTTLPDDYVHYYEPRILTVREYARIQSFPDWYLIKGKYTTGGSRRKDEVPRYSQLGNAIPPLFGELAGSVMHTVSTATQATKRIAM